MIFHSNCQRYCTVDLCQTRLSIEGNKFHVVEWVEVWCFFRWWARFAAVVLETTISLDVTLTSQLDTGAEINEDLLDPISQRQGSSV